MKLKLTLGGKQKGGKFVFKVLLSHTNILGGVAMKSENFGEKL